MPAMSRFYLGYSEDDGGFLLRDSTKEYEFLLYDYDRTQWYRVVDGSIIGKATDDEIASTLNGLTTFNESWFTKDTIVNGIPETKEEIKWRPTNLRMYRHDIACRHYSGEFAFYLSIYSFSNTSITVSNFREYFDTTIGASGYATYGTNKFPIHKLVKDADDIKAGYTASYSGDGEVDLNLEIADFTDSIISL